MDRPRRTTLIPAALTITPDVPAAKIDPYVPVQSMVIDLVMVTAPNPPGSRQLISPPAAVLLIAPAKVLHGAVRLHGLASSPTPDTQVRIACALAGAADNVQVNRHVRNASRQRIFISAPFCLAMTPGSADRLLLRLLGFR